MRYPWIRPRRGSTRFTHLAACVSEEDGSFTVQVRLSDEAEPQNRAWGEEIADSFEMASAMLESHQGLADAGQGDRTTQGAQEMAAADRRD